MKAALKAAWVAALRSGKYRQGNKALHLYGGKRCCLGVLAAVAGLKRGTVTTLPGGIRCFPYDGETEIFQPNHLEEFGFTRYQQSTLTNMNDIEGKTFDEIADWIEDNIDVDPTEPDEEETDHV